MTIGTSTCCSAFVSVLKLDGSTLKSISAFGTNGTTLNLPELTATGDVHDRDRSARDRHRIGDAHALRGRDQFDHDWHATPLQIGPSARNFRSWPLLWRDRLLNPMWVPGPSTSAGEM